MDIEKYTASRFYTFFDVLYKLMIINIIWTFFGFAGFVVLTIFPATVALYIIVDSSVVKGQEISVYKTFIKIFIKEYIKSQKLMLVIGGIALVLYVDVYFFYENIAVSAFYTIGFWLSIILSGLFVFTLIHVFMVYYSFPRLKTFKILKYSFLLSIAFSVQTVLIMAYMVIVVLAIIQFPIIIPMVPILFMASIAYVSIRLLKNKYALLTKDQLPLQAEDYVNY